MPKCPVGPDLGVAICLVGFVRTLPRPEVYTSISNFFRNQSKQADFFGVVSSSGDDTAKGQWKEVSQAELEPAMRMLRPVAWEDTPDRRGPRCGLLCMRQYDRLDRCRELISAREAECGGRYAWVVKARPDARMRSRGGRSIAADGLRNGDTIYKDRRAGDLVTYIPRKHWEASSHYGWSSPHDSLSFYRLFFEQALSRTLSSTPCERVRSVGIDCSHSAAATGGGGCKCNLWLTMAVTGLLKLRTAYHPFGVELVRTAESRAVIEESRRRFGGDGMRGLHNMCNAPPPAPTLFALPLTPRE